MQEFAERQGPINHAKSQTTTDSLPKTPPPMIYRIPDNASGSHGAHSSSHSLPDPETLVSPLTVTQPRAELEGIQDEDEVELAANSSFNPSSVHKRSFDTFAGENLVDFGLDQVAPSQATESFSSTISVRDSTARWHAYYQMLDNVTTDTWNPIELISTSDEHTVMDQEL